MGYAKAENGLGFLKNKLRFLANGDRLRSHRTYIVPTGFGFGFAGISFVLLVMAIGYANNLLYFFVFFLISMAVTGMWITNRNVDCFQILGLQVDMLFAAENNRIDILVASRNSEMKLWEIDIQIAKGNENGEVLRIADVQFEKKVTFQWRPSKRGYYPMPRLLIEGRFPFQMLRAWKYYEEKNELYIFPQRKGVETIPRLKDRQSDKEDQAQAHDEGLFRDFREFQKSDSPKRIDWKRSLKHQKHLVKNFELSGDKKVLLDWEMTDFIKDFEGRISQLAFWIDQCHKKNELYSLRIQKFETSFGSQINHYKLCMQKLAELKEEDVL